MQSKSTSAQDQTGCLVDTFRQLHHHLERRKAAVEIIEAVDRVLLEGTQTRLQLGQVAMTEYFDHAHINTIDHIHGQFFGWTAMLVAQAAILPSEPLS